MADLNQVNLIGRLSRDPDHQIQELKRRQIQGNRAGFVVWFRGEDPFGRNIRFFEDFCENPGIESGVRFDSVLGV